MTDPGETYVDQEPERLTLLFDADDTLWENNVRFERVIEDYVAWLAHPTLDPAALRRLLNDVERANSAVHGYGAAIFLRTLHDLFERLNERPTTAEESEHIYRLGEDLLSHNVELMPGVADVLRQLGARHELRLVTKGTPSEQHAKLDASGLRAHFASVHVLREKDVPTYQALVDELGLDPGRTWMIGNSPKSDIAPARAVGLRAVYIPNDNTWVLERGELDPDESGVVTLRALSGLLDLF